MTNRENLHDQQQLVLGRMLELTDLMLKGAREQQWESVRELQLVRDGLIRDFFDADIEVERQRLMAGVNYIIDSDQKLAKLGIEERSSLYEQIYRLKQGKSAIKAYTAG